MTAPPTTAPGLRASRCSASRHSPVGSVELDRSGFDFGDRHQLYRIFGLMKAYEMSTRRFTSTKMIARKRIPPWSTG